MSNRSDRDELRKALGSFGLNLLKEDFKFFVNSWLERRNSKKFLKAMYESRMMTKETYEQLLDGKVDYSEPVNFMNHAAAEMVKYSSEMLSFDVSEKFDGINFNYGKISKDHYKFEGSITTDQNDVSRINISIGTLLHFDYLSILNCTVAGKVPALSNLLIFDQKIRETFIGNYSFDNRGLLEQMTNPEEVYFIQTKFFEWFAEMNPIQGLVAIDLLKAMRLVLIGHEFGHFINRLSRERPQAFLWAQLFCDQNGIAANDNKLEEFSCDIIGHKLAVHFLKETNIHRTSNGVFSSKLLSLQNPNAALLGRGQALNLMLAFEESVPRDKHKDFDADVLILAAAKILFFNLSKIDNSDSDSHPSPRDRLKFLERAFYTRHDPKLIGDLTASIEFLHASLESGVRHAMLDHPHWRDLMRVR